MPAAALLTMCSRSPWRSFIFLFNARSNMAFRSGARDVFRLAPLGFPALARPELILLWWMTWADPIFFIRVTDIRTEDGISALLPTASIKGVATNGFCRLYPT